MAAKLLVTPRVQHTDGSWQVYLDADDGDGSRYGVDAKASDVGSAARGAADKLLVALGHHAAGNPPDDAPIQILIRRIDAAVMADDPDAARALIAQASADDQQLPELRLRLAKIDFRAGRLEILVGNARGNTRAGLDQDRVAAARGELLDGLGSGGDARLARAGFRGYADVHGFFLSRPKRSPMIHGLV